MRIGKSKSLGPLPNEASFEILSDEDQLEIIGGAGDELIVWPHAIDIE
jgi:hypothetical protein